MKRSVAILGPTPQFVRWAMEHTCPLRETDVDNLPDSTFRQLRGLRELSIGLIEKRVFENICVHPASTGQDAMNARGFKAGEVLDVHGDSSDVENCCRSCSANAVSDLHPGIWAGCYGWFPATNDFCVESNLRDGQKMNESKEDLAHQPNRIDYVGLIDDVIKHVSAERAAQLFDVTTPRWYGIWKNRIMTQEQVDYLLGVFESATTNCLDMGADPVELADLVQLRDALKRSSDHRLRLHVDLVPPGVSDGQTWTLSAYCPDCKFALSEIGRQRCPSCGRIGSPHGQRKSKVLGLRPYVNLEGVMGRHSTVEFMQRFHSRS